MKTNPPMAHEPGGTDTLDWQAIPESWTERGGTVVEATADERLYFATRVHADLDDELLVVKYVRPERAADADVAFVRVFRGHRYEGGLVPQIVADADVGGRAFPAVMRQDRGESTPGVQRDERDLELLEERYPGHRSILYRRG